MSQATNQHYVPQSYLKSFSCKKSQIFIFDKFDQRIFTSNVRNVASERAFYDFPESISQSKSVQTIEQFFSELEARQDRFLRHIQKKISCIFKMSLTSEHVGKTYSTNAITADQRQDLACITAIQFLRTKEFREFIVDMRQAIEPLPLTKQALEQVVLDQINYFQLLTSTKLNERLASDLTSIILNESNSTVSSIYNEGLAVVHAKFILDNYSEIAQILSNHVWMIGINHTGRPLFTSDHPVVRYSHLSSVGITSEGIEISFPLNSTMILIMREKQHFSDFIKQDSKLFPLTLEDVEHFNKLQACSSFRFVFCAENCFDLVQEICRQCPDLCSENRSRIQIKIEEV